MFTTVESILWLTATLWRHDELPLKRVQSSRWMWNWMLITRLRTAHPHHHSKFIIRIYGFFPINPKLATVTTFLGINFWISMESIATRLSSIDRFASPWTRNPSGLNPPSISLSLICCRGERDQETTRQRRTATDSERQRETDRRQR